MYVDTTNTKKTPITPQDFQVSRPCADCAEQLIRAKVRQVIFTDPDPEGWGDYCDRNMPSLPIDTQVRDDHGYEGKVREHTRRKR